MGQVSSIDSNAMKYVKAQKVEPIPMATDQAGRMREAKEVGLGHPDLSNTRSNGVKGALALPCLKLDHLSLSLPCLKKSNSLFLLRARVYLKYTEPRRRATTGNWFSTAHDVHIDLLCASTSSIAHTSYV